MPAEVMTADQLSAYLQLDIQTIYRKFREGGIPGIRIGKAVRFKRDVIDAWLRSESWGWGTRERADLRKWAAGHASRLGLREKDALAAVRRLRRRGG